MKQLWYVILNFFDNVVYTHKRKKLLKELKKRDPFIY